MITDPLFYRLFETSPETLFLVLGMSPDQARAMAARYQFSALEFKETAHRADGVFQPKEPGLPAYFVETQFYRLPTVYADILVKSFTYLKQNDPGQAFCAVVLFGNRTYEPESLVPYESLLDSGQLRRIFLNELPEMPDAPLGLSILRLIGQKPEPAALSARKLIARAKSEVSDAALRNPLLQLIETVIIYKLPLLSREEVQAMLEVNDIRETRVYQEGREEGREEGRVEERERILKEKLESIPKLATRGLSATDIADILKLDLQLVIEALGRKLN